MSIKLLRHELLGIVLCLMGTDYINSANAQQTDQQTIVTKAEAALAAKIKCRDFRKNAAKKEFRKLERDQREADD